jgi:RNA polymerase-binding transcription factor DksA
MKIDTERFKAILEAEKEKLEAELGSIGQRNPNNPKDWQATPGDFGGDTADRNDVADSIEEYEEHAAILKDLEIRYNEVLSAIKRIDGGRYGICEIGGEQIDEKRLLANPAATTCTAHIRK